MIEPPHHITVEIKTVYGREAIYPACPKSITFTDMLGQSTLTRRDIEYIKQLGYQINIKQPEITL